MVEENARSSEKNWLIKSSTRILGPFSLDELTQHLRSKQISIIDEIRQPHGRWMYIRESPMLMDIVSHIRDEPDMHSEKTMTQSIAHHTMTKTDAILPEELTPPPSADSDLTPPPLRDVGIKDVTPRAETIVPRSSASVGTQSYGSALDRGLQEKLRRRSELVRWSLIGLAVVIAVGVVIAVTQKDKRNAVGYEELMAQAIRYKNIGLYERSLQAYMKATKLREPDPESAAQMAPVLISEDRQTLVGRRILEKILGAEGRGRSEMVSAYLGIAVSYMIDGDLRQAEDTLQRAVGHEPFNVSTLLNLAIIQLRRGQYAEAAQNFDNIYRRNPQSLMALFGRALATLEQARSHVSAGALNSLINDIKQATHKTGYLRQELLLLKIHAHQLLGDMDGVYQSTAQFLNQLSGESRKYIHPLEVDWRITQWENLEKYCAEIFIKNPSNPEMKALRAVCLLEVNRDSEAVKFMQEAMAEAPKNPYVLATQAGYLESTSRVPEAMAVLKSPELGNLLIKHRLMGRICIGQQDIECAEKAFTQIYNQERESALAAYGLAWAALAQKDQPRAYGYVRNGLQAEPNYTPLLEMREKLESE